MKAQGLPINMIVIIALSLLVLVVVGAFFITGMGRAGPSMMPGNQTCPSMCTAIKGDALASTSCETIPTSNANRYCAAGCAAEDCQGITTADGTSCTLICEDGTASFSAT